MLISILNRELKETTRAMAARRSLIKRINEQNSGCARAYPYVHISWQSSRKKARFCDYVTHGATNFRVFYKARLRRNEPILIICYIHIFGIGLELACNGGLSHNVILDCFAVLLIIEK